LNILEKTRLAFQRDEVKNLLLGAPFYQINNRFAPLPRGVQTDISTVLTAGLYRLKNEDPSMEKQLIPALISISDTPLGIWTLASFIMLENDTRLDRAPILNINLEDLAKHLKNKIIEHKAELQNEHELLNGNNYKNGVLGELARLAKITTKDSGPSFMPNNLIF